MSTTGLTGTAVNGVYEITAANNISTNGGADTEQILLYSSGALRASSSATLTFTACNFFINDTGGTGGNPNTTILSYNADSTSRADQGRYIRFFDCNIIYNCSARRNIFVSELTRSNVFDQDAAGQLFVYTQPNSIMNTVIIRGINTLEVVGQFDEAFNMTFDNVNKSYLNWEAGRLDFFGIAVLNKPTGTQQASAWFGTGNSGNNYAWHWNNDTTFDNERIYLTSVNNRYYDGVTLSWEFIDRDTSSVIQNVKVKVKDDFPGVAASGSMAERGEYLTNSSGHIAGTWDGQNRTTVTTGDRNTAFIVRNAVTRVDTNANTSGTKTYPVAIISGDQGDRGENYELDPVLNQIEVKAYLYEAPTGFLNGNTFDSSIEIGKIASDLSVEAYSNFILVKDAGITQTTKATVDAYTTLETLDKAYDRIKSEWYGNDGYPLPVFSSATLDLGAVDIIINGTGSSAYTYSSGDITISTNTGDKNLDTGTKVSGITTTGVITVQNGATIDGLILVGDVVLTSAVDLTGVIITGDLNINTGANSTLDFSNVDVQGSVYNDATGNTLTINSTNGSSLTAGDAGSANGETNIVQTVPIKVIVKDIVSGDFIENALVLIEAASGGDLPAYDTVTSITSVGTTATVNHTTHGLKTDEYVIIRSADQKEYNGQYQITVTSVNQYTYTFAGSATSPATGTITSTARLVRELTDVDGEVNETHRYTNDQPVEGVVRKATQ